MFSKIPEVKLTGDLTSPDFDAVVVVAPSIGHVKHPELKKALNAVAEIDKSADKGVWLAPCADVAGKRVIYSGTGALDQDIDDVRCFGEAMEKGVKKALAAGCRSPLLAFGNGTEEFSHSKLVSVLGAFKALYVPLEMREGRPEKAVKMEKFGVLDVSEKDVQLASGIEEGKAVCRDIGGSDPERMAPPRVAEYVTNLFKGTCVKVEVVKGHETLKKEYPCLAAVDRAANQPSTSRHHGCVIWLTYEPEGPVTDTVMMVGKGITYDTGGADIKAGGIMAGMSRDKCGSAVVAGFFKTVAELKPKGLKVVGAMCMVRNSVGSNCYVADEIITSRNGMRLRVGNTDAEGRMAMVDVLCHMREKALNEVNPHLMTIATLTGHAVVAMGNYTAIIDNGPARKVGFSRAIFDTGEACGDQFELSSLRRDDYDLVWDKSREFVDVLQCNNVPSSRTLRGHQLPAAFMHLVSGLDKHQTKSEKPLKYTHLDVAGSSGRLPDPTTAAGVTALAMHFVEPRLKE